MLANDILQAVGNTPLVGIQRLSPNPGVRLWAKLEGDVVLGQLNNETNPTIIFNSSGGYGVSRPGHQRRDRRRGRRSSRSRCEPSLAGAQGVGPERINSATDRYWGAKWYIWNNDKDTAYLKGPKRGTIDTCSYNNSGASYKIC